MPTNHRRLPHCRLLLAVLCIAVAAGRPEQASGQAAMPIERQDTGWWASTQRTMVRASKLAMGKKLLDPQEAREVYQQADAAFREAAATRKPDQGSADQEQAASAQRDQDAFEKAAEMFRSVYDSQPESALGQDALFMYAESLFFADRFTDAADVFQKLQKDFPRNRHSDRVAARLFSITQYWIDIEKAREDDWFTLNLFDPKVPRMDAKGHAVRVLDQIRYDDPTGRLADDATMAAAAEYLRQEKYEMADEFLTDLRETFPGSDHFFLAHLLGIRCKLELYAGPRYSSLMLDEADKLIKQTRERFPVQMREQRYSDMLARAAAEVDYLRGEHLYERARYREKRREYRAATRYYQEVLDRYSETPFGKKARERLQRTAALPPVPQQRLSWLQRVFPDGEKSTPLELNFQSPTGENRDTILR